MVASSRVELKPKVPACDFTQIVGRFYHLDFQFFVTTLASRQTWQAHLKWDKTQVTAIKRYE